MLRKNLKCGRISTKPSRMNSSLLLTSVEWLTSFFPTKTSCCSYMKNCFQDSYHRKIWSTKLTSQVCNRISLTMGSSDQRQHLTNHLQLIIVYAILNQIFLKKAMLLETRSSSAKCHQPRVSSRDWIQLQIASKEEESETQPEQHRISDWIHIVWLLAQRLSYLPTRIKSHVVNSPKHDSQTSKVVWQTAITTWWVPKPIQQMLSQVKLEMVHHCLHQDLSLERAYTTSN